MQLVVRDLGWGWGWSLMRARGGWECGLGDGGDWSFLLTLICKVQAVLSKMRYTIMMGRS